MNPDTKTTKAYQWNDPSNNERLFQRIEYEFYDDTDTDPDDPSHQPHLSGQGFTDQPTVGPACHCHTNDDAPGGFRTTILRAPRRAMRAIPAWVPPADNNHPNVEREVQGQIARSFQTWTDVPAIQWHRYYDWNFHIEPDKGFRYARGDANRGGTPDEGAQLVIPGNNMECEWDCGLLGTRPGPMFYAHWHWPLKGNWVWAAGRSIYDCGHPTADDATGRMRSELHPLKAVASAHREAEKFAENGNLYTPAVKFMFFACGLGGYYRFSNAEFTNKDYKFIVDLPPLGNYTPHTIGHTPRYRRNTIRLRPRMLMKIDPSPFQNAQTTLKQQQEAYWRRVWPDDYNTAQMGSETPTVGNVTPVIELAPDFDPAAPQAVITIPLSGIGQADTYGVIISLGWLDPDGSQARRVKRVSVSFDNLHTEDIVHDRFSLEEWFLKMGVNGRWFWYYSGEDTVDHDTDIPFSRVENGQMVRPFEHVFYLADTDSIRLCSHGAEINPVDDIFHNRDRTVRLNGRAVDFVADIQNGSFQQQQDIFWEFIDLQQATLGMENEPLGLIEEVRPVSSLTDGQRESRTLQGFHTTEIAHSAEPQYRANEVDYQLTYSIQVDPQ